MDLKEIRKEKENLEAELCVIIQEKIDSFKNKTSVDVQNVITNFQTHPADVLNGSPVLEWYQLRSIKIDLGFI